MVTACLSQIRKVLDRVVPGVCPESVFSGCLQWPAKPVGQYPAEAR